MRNTSLQSRIQGIKDINRIVSSHRMYGFKTFTTEQLIDFFVKNEVVEMLFDSKKTHVQLV